jgi:hypothetical protein
MQECERASKTTTTGAAPGRCAMPSLQRLAWRSAHRCFGLRSIELLSAYKGHRQL